MTSGPPSIELVHVKEQGNEFKGRHPVGSPISMDAPEETGVFATTSPVGGGGGNCTWNVTLSNIRKHPFADGIIFGAVVTHPQPGSATDWIGSVAHGVFLKTGLCRSGAENVSSIGVTKDGGSEKSVFSTFTFNEATWGDVSDVDVSVRWDGVSKVEFRIGKSDWRSATGKKAAMSTSDGCASPIASRRLRLSRFTPPPFQDTLFVTHVAHEQALMECAQSLAAALFASSSNTWASGRIRSRG